MIRHGCLPPAQASCPHGPHFHAWPVHQGLCICSGTVAVALGQWRCPASHPLRPFGCPGLRAWCVYGCHEDLDWPGLTAREGGSHDCIHYHIRAGAAHRRSLSGFVRNAQPPVAFDRYWISRSPQHPCHSRKNRDRTTSSPPQTCTASMLQNSASKAGFDVVFDIDSEC